MADDQLVALALRLGPTTSVDLGRGTIDLYFKSYTGCYIIVRLCWMGTTLS